MFPLRSSTGKPQDLFRLIFISTRHFYVSSFPSFIVAHPEYQKMFKSFAAVPQNELLGNGNFLAQAYTILAGLNVVIQSLSSQELLANQINALGGAHQPRGATPIMFEVGFQTQILTRYFVLAY